MRHFILSLFCVLLAHPVSAAVFRNSYVSFELPDHWNCAPDGTEWVCRSASKSEQSEAIIVLTGKEAGPQDTMDFFMTKLRKPRTLEGRGGTKLTSTVEYTKPVKINDRTWIDSLHISSELPKFYTRYVVTAEKDDVAVLVTFSSHQSVYTKYVSDFFNAIKSIRVIKGVLPSRMGLAGSQGGILGPNTGEFSLDPGPGGYDNPQNQKSSSSSDLLVGLAIVLLAAGGYLWMKSKKKTR
jgi:hypothetical protein